MTTKTSKTTARRRMVEALAARAPEMRQALEGRDLAGLIRVALKSGLLGKKEVRDLVTY